MIAPVHLLRRERRENITAYTLSPGEVPRELARLEQALQRAGAELDALIEAVTLRIGPAQANIFLAQKLMTQDEVLVAQMREYIDQRHRNAELAIAHTLDGYESLLQEVDDDYLKERASDIGEMRRRLLDLLQPAAGEEKSAVDLLGDASGCILIAEELTPGETVLLDTTRVRGFITERGGAASHAAILARALGIPSVSGIKSILTAFEEGDMALLNGTTGDVVRMPGERTLALYPALDQIIEPVIEVVAPVPGFQVMGNISLTTDLETLNRMEPDGIGLYRTEFEFFSAGKALNEDEQYACYRTVVEAMGGKPVYIRLLDLGGDKSAPFLDLPKEENPCLGYRGCRLLQGEPSLFIPQARALARASVHGPIHIVYPMIVDVTQFVTLRTLFNQHVAGIPQGTISHGVMFEVPSACLEAAEIYSVADFGSIGSNDLIQYLFAVDRNNDLVARDYSPDRSAFWTLIRVMADAAQAAGKPLSLCGEIGGQPQHLPRLMSLGLRSISVSPRLIPLSRATARQVLGARAAAQ